MDKIEKIKNWLKPYLKENKVRDEHEEGFFHCAMLLNDFIDTLSEEPDKSLEEAAEDFVWEVMENDDEGISELSKKLRPTSKISDYYDALGEFFKAGAEWQKVQMMKKAVEGYVTLTLAGVLTVAATIKEGDNIGIGDKVRIIIVKEG